MAYTDAYHIISAFIKHLLLEGVDYLVKKFFKKKGSDKEEALPFTTREEELDKQAGIYDQESPAEKKKGETQVTPQVNGHVKGETQKVEEYNFESFASENAQLEDEIYHVPELETEMEDIFPGDDEFTVNQGEKNDLPVDLPDADPGTPDLPKAGLADEDIIMEALKAQVKALTTENEQLKMENRGLMEAASTKMDEAAEKDAEEPIERLAECLTVLEESFQKLNKDFTDKLKADESKEKIIDNLHRELQGYKDDQLKDIIKPLINDLILMADRKRKIIKKAEEGDLSTDKLLRILNESIQDVEDILYRQGIDPFSSSDGHFDSKVQQIVKTFKTEDLSKDKMVAEVVGKGYQWDGKLFRHEKVNIFVYDKPKEK
jgi:molecular chaperone GrpE